MKPQKAKNDKKNKNNLGNGAKFIKRCSKILEKSLQYVKKSKTANRFLK